MNLGTSVAPLLREAAALVYVDDLEAPELGFDDAHHLSTVLRLRPGELVVVSDGAGSYRSCRVAAGSRQPGSGSESAAGRRRGQPPSITLLPDAEVATVARVGPQVTVGFSVAKGDRTDWAVAKLSELGVDVIVPVVCERTAVRWSDQAATRQHARLGRIAREASMQARRLWLPEILELLPIADVAGRLGSGIALAEPGGEAPSLAAPVILVGPEGGFTPRELALGFPLVTLGDTILRVETAAVVAGAMLTGLRAGVVSSHLARGAPAVVFDRSE